MNTRRGLLVALLAGAFALGGCVVRTTDHHHSRGRGHGHAHGHHKHKKAKHHHKPQRRDHRR